MLLDTIWKTRNMQALRFHGPGDLRLEEVPVPQLEADEVLVAVDACGVCGSDLHFFDGSARTAHLPITLGHEVAGTIADAALSPFATGSKVVVEPGASCGECPRCADGRSNLCEQTRLLGIGVDGGFAEFVAVPAQSVVRRPDDLAAADAATAVDAGATARHAVLRTGAVSSGDSVLIIGVGGLGGFAMQMALNAGAGLVIAADVDPAALERASRLGADEVVEVRPGESLGRAIKLLTEGGVDVALEFVGLASTVDAAVKCLRPGGRAVAVGVGNQPLTTIPPVLWSNHEYTLTGSYGSLPGDTAQVLADLASGSLVPPETKTVSIEDAPRAIASLADKGSGVARLMVTP
jgi:threonine dehydrogenase-like Zn-dependent dehydrogenase